MSDFLDGAVILSSQVIKVFNLEYFKTDQTTKHQQAINASVRHGWVTFVHDGFPWNSVRVDGLFERRGNHRFISKFRKYKANGIAN